MNEFDENFTFFECGDYISFIAKAFLIVNQHKSSITQISSRTCLEDVY